MPPFPQPNPRPHPPDIGTVIASHRPAGLVSLILTWIVVLALAPIIAIPFLFSLSWWFATLIALQILAFWLFLVWLTLRETRKTIDFGTHGLQVRIGDRVARTLMYADVHQLTYFPMTVRSHGVTIGTSVILRIKPHIGPAFAFHRLNPPASTSPSPLPPLSMLDPVRDLIAGAQAQRMFLAWQSQGHIDWTKRLIFYGYTLNYKPLLGSIRRLPLHDCVVVPSPWSITLISHSTQKKFLEFPTTEPNTWAGLVLLLRLLNDRAGKAADLQR